MNRKFLTYAVLVSLLATVLGACNKSSDNSTSTEVIYSSSNSSTLVQSFKLQKKDKALANLDSVKFVIDQDRRVIYNPDSLPMGTDVTHLLTTVQFGTTVSKAQFVVGGGKVQVNDTVIDYSTSSKDSIDFTGQVTLNVTSADGSNTQGYRIMVNVHKEDPDSIVFPLTSRRDLPAAADDNYAMGMARLGSTFYSMVNNSNGRYVATAETPAGRWDAQKVELAFEPQENTLTATSDALYVLDSEGNLYTSTDAQSWTATGAKWESVIGAYGDRVLGVADNDGQRMMDEYPRRSDFAPAALPDGFPVNGRSQLIAEQSTWALGQTALMVGGRDANGNLINTTWGYDGNTWGELSHSSGNPLPAIEGATLYSYITYNVSVYTQHATPRVTWVVMGGRLADGSLNRTTYLSRDMGITWNTGYSVMSIPTYIPSFSGALAFVCSETMSSKAVARRVSKPVTEWEVPYIYIVGGTGTDGKLLNNVWKGVINRMLYKPIY